MRRTSTQQLKTLAIRTPNCTRSTTHSPVQQKLCDRKIGRSCGTCDPKTLSTSSRNSKRIHCSSSIGCDSSSRYTYCTLQGCIGSYRNCSPEINTKVSSIAYFPSGGFRLHTRYARALGTNVTNTTAESSKAALLPSPSPHHKDKLCVVLDMVPLYTMRVM